ncbi:YopX family protein [Lactococcus lactis]|uniref:YopX family protein n=1 Tax=Lactococcus lactis TaxID=1358 RepID=UPI002890396D|nr:YopX family protein [Lactococcus lactis]MDT2932416.1 YopX family protein [Lactococcus lactis]
MIPKFRAWDKEENRMIDDYEVLISSDGCAYYNHYEGGLRDLGFDVEIMQSTGLKDKNGVEIFEGDIVNYVKSFTNPMTGSGSLSINKNLRIIFKDAEFTADGIDIRLKKIVSHMEVIGNIWEDGELLEGHEK